MLSGEPSTRHHREVHPTAGGHVAQAKHIFIYIYIYTVIHTNLYALLEHIHMHYLPIRCCRWRRAPSRNAPSGRWRRDVGYVYIFRYISYMYMHIHIFIYTNIYIHTPYLPIRYCRWCPWPLRNAPSGQWPRDVGYIHAYIGKHSYIQTYIYKYSLPPSSLLFSALGAIAKCTQRPVAT